MRYSILSIIALLCVQLSQGQNEAKAIEGYWLNHEKNSVIKIYQKDDTFFGRIHQVLLIPEDKAKGLSQAQIVEGKKKMRGKLILSNLIYAEGSWVKGIILNPKDGSTKAKCSISLDDKGNLILKAKKGLFSANKTWTRYELKQLSDEN